MPFAFTAPVPSACAAVLEGHRPRGRAGARDNRLDRGGKGQRLAGHRRVGRGGRHRDRCGLIESLRLTRDRRDIHVVAASAADHRIEDEWRDQMVVGRRRGQVQCIGVILAVGNDVEAETLSVVEARGIVSRPAQPANVGGGVGLAYVVGRRDIEFRNAHGLECGNRPDNLRIVACQVHLVVAVARRTRIAVRSPPVLPVGDELIVRPRIGRMLVHPVADVAHRTEDQIVAVIVDDLGIEDFDWSGAM